MVQKSDCMSFDVEFSFDNFVPDYFNFIDFVIQTKFFEFMLRNMLLKFLKKVLEDKNGKNLSVD